MPDIAKNLIPDEVLDAVNTYRKTLAEDDDVAYLALDLFDAQSSLRCPYYQRGEKCDTGCWSEPSCITDEPEAGWAGQAAKTLAKLEVLHGGPFTPIKENR